MDIKQIASMMNEITNEILGTENIVTEDLSNIVDVGVQIFNAKAVDAYVRTLVNHIGRVVFVDRVYQGTAPSVLMDGWEYGSVLEKITSDELPEAVENESWNLVDGQTYDPHVFHAPKVSAKFFNKRVTFEIEMSFTEMQIKQSFSNVNQLNGFISMIQTSVENSMTVKLDSLIARTINHMIARTILDDYGETAFNAKSGLKAVNLLYLYNQTYTAELTAEKAVTTPDFIRFAAYQIGLYKDRLTKISTLFNIGGKERFTPTNSLNVILLSEFKRAADVFLQSETFHEEYTKLVDAEVVPYWQGSGKDYAFENTSKIKLLSLNEDGETKNGITASGILGFMFDRNALGVCNLDRRVTTAYNPKGEYYNNFYKMDAGYFNDGNENAIVFFIA